MIVNLFTSGGGSSLMANFLPGSSVPKNLNGPGTPAYAWLPVTMPSNVVSMTFDYIVTGYVNSDSFAVAMGGTNVLSVASNLIQTNVVLNSKPIDVSQYAGQQVELFLGIVGGTSTNASVTASNFQFYSFLPPTLQAQLARNNLLTSWPLSSSDYVLETSNTLTGTNSWATVTNVPAIVDFQNTVTNPITPGSRFYRLKK